MGLRYLEKQNLQNTKKKKRYLSSTKNRLDFYRCDRKMSFQPKRTE